MCSGSWLRGCNQKRKRRSREGRTRDEDGDGDDGGDDDDGGGDDDDGGDDGDDVGDDGGGGDDDDGGGGGDDGGDDGDDVGGDGGGGGDDGDKALAKRSSQLKPTRAKFTTSMELGIVWPPTWLELAWIWWSSNIRATRARFSTVWPPQPTLAKLFCYRYVTTRSYSDDWMVSCELTRLAGIVWPPAEASFDFVTWFKLAWVGSTV